MEATLDQELQDDQLDWGRWKHPSFAEHATYACQLNLVDNGRTTKVRLLWKLCRTRLTPSSKSLSRLEKTIEPMAEKVDDIHSQLNGGLNVKIDEIHHLMLSMASMSVDGSPSLQPMISRDGSIGHRDFASGHFSRASTLAMDGPEYSEQRASYPSPVQTPEFKGREYPADPEAFGWKNSYTSRTSPSKFQPSYSSGLISPKMDEEDDYARYRPKSQASYSPRASRADSNLFSQNLARSPSEVGPSPQSPMLPPPAMGEDPKALSEGYQHSTMPSSDFAPAMLSRSVTTESQQEEFQRSIFLDSALLCDVRGTCVEYTIPDEETPGDLKLVKATTDCRLCLVTKRKKLSTGGLSFSTSIWALSDDRRVRMQQECTSRTFKPDAKLTNLVPDGEEVVPYTIWGNLEKVAIRLSTELRFHDIVFDAKPLNSANSSWVNYVFEDERASTMFQSALMGKSLLLSVRTNKTLRLHDGLIENTFSYQEQMCALENLRMWQDPDTGGVLAMVHYSAQFRDGYLAFYLNSARDPVRLREEGDKWVKIKGLSILPPPSKSKSRSNTLESHKSPKANKEKRIKGAKIEFTSEFDRQRFMDKIREVQGMFYAGEV